jgi:hypothetical protein
MSSTRKTIILITTVILSYSCAGPTTPFGAELFHQKRFDAIKTRSVASSFSFLEDKIQITSSPKTKLFHKPYDLSFIIKNPRGLKQPFQYNILYNGQIIERWLKTEEIQFNKDHTEATITFKGIRLKPELTNNITFLYYDKENHAPLFYDLTSPECSLSRYTKIKRINPFNEKQYLLKKMNKVAKDRDINPILLASLVAQESSFNPKAVSIARAVGLTQVTPIADHDIRSINPTLVSYPNTSKMSYLDLKYKIYKGIINEKNDWRLNEEKSLEGGAIYLEWLKNYWTNKQNKRFLSRHLTNIKETDIILASYNSGATRVRKNIIKLKNRWLYSNQLGEAKKYVYNIKSYCNDFKEKK